MTTPRHIPNDLLSDLSADLSDLPSGGARYLSVRVLCVVAFLLFFPGLLSAQPWAAPDSEPARTLSVQDALHSSDSDGCDEPHKASPEESLKAPGPTTAPCEDGVVRDDGSAETAYGWVPSVVDGRYVQEYRLQEFPTQNVESVCVCWRRTRMDTDIDFEVHFYSHWRYVADDGQVFWIPEMEPFAVVEASATDVTDDVAGTWTQVDVGNVELPICPYFSVGVKWNPSVDQFFFVCDDTTPTTPRSGAWFIDDRARGWGSVLFTIDPIFDVHRALMIRALPGERLPSVVEVPSLGQTGMLLLVLAMGWVGWRRLAGH